MTRRKHPSGKHAYDGLDPLDAVVAAWEQPADTADMDILTRERVREASPQLGRALDGLTIAFSTPRKDHTK